MATSQNGWPALSPDSPKLYTWVIPAKTGAFTLRLRNGSAGFLLAHYALWYAERIEPVAGKVLDDWGYAYREVRGGVSLSNHASGTAIDLNATAHPLGTEVEANFTPSQINAIRRRMGWYRGILRWGGDYTSRKDGMHVELNRSLGEAESRARSLMRWGRGRLIIKANPSQRAVILS